MLHTSSSVSPVTDLVADARGVGCYARNLVTCGYPFSGGCLDGCSSGLTDAITAHCGECVGHLFPSQLQRTAENGYPRVSASSTSEVEQVRRATSRRAVRCASVAFWILERVEDLLQRDLLLGPSVRRPPDDPICVHAHRTRSASASCYLRRRRTRAARRRRARCITHMLPCPVAPGPRIF